MRGGVTSAAAASATSTRAKPGIIVGTSPRKRRRQEYKSPVPIPCLRAIPANDAKGEPDHWHFDFRYAFRLVGDGAVRLQEDEVDGFRWVPLSELGDTPSEKIVADKLARVVG